MAPILYGIDKSPAVRGVFLTAAALELELDFKEVDIMAGETRTPEFLKMNPTHTVPTLDDDGYILWDSHAISGYLVNKYAQDDSLYPKDPNQRGTIDQRLHFNGGTLFPRLSACVVGIIFEGDKSIPDEKVDKVREAYGYLEAMLVDNYWLAGETLTIADLCTAATVSTANELIPIDPEECPRLVLWLEQCAELPYYQDANGVGLEKIASILKMKMEE